MEKITQPSLHDRLMYQSRIDEAKSIRNLARTHLRFGHRLEHRLIMQQTRLPLLLARQWKPK